MKLRTAYFVVSFYVLGALIIENDVNYSTWYQIESTSFSAYHQSLESHLRIYLFTPMAIQFLLNGLLIRQKPVALRSWFIVTLVLNGYIIGESLLVQVPIHKALTNRYSVDLIDRLIMYHLWWRLPAELLVGGINTWLLHRCLRGGF
ncbi:hypothetical protein GCM10028803_58330 [Larkinella knui]|uniref:DUF1772 domain-containing protein n=1 Tax=Larkinella knui TaxID=2025310 RepID=A0A3P1CI49_9BACT|nr:hypothetical protein [Larkinella knui]RRB12736.1 hypothetical protein EHT87_21380 [Larkinella knui]